MEKLFFPRSLASRQETGGVQSERSSVPFLAAPLLRLLCTLIAPRRRGKVKFGGWGLAYTFMLGGKSPNSSSA